MDTNQGNANPFRRTGFRGFRDLCSAQPHELATPRHQGLRGLQIPRVQFAETRYVDRRIHAANLSAFPRVGLHQIPESLHQIRAEGFRFLSCRLHKHALDMVTALVRSVQTDLPFGG